MFSHTPRRPLLSRNVSFRTDHDTGLENPRTVEVSLNTDAYDDDVCKLRVRVQCTRVGGRAH